MSENPRTVSPFMVRAGDVLAGAVNELVRKGAIGSRSKVADALLNYASIRFGDRDPIGDLEKEVGKHAKQT